MAGRILVTAGRAPAALEWVRALARDGWSVLVGDSLRFTASGFSRYCGGRVSLPPARFSPSLFRREVLKLIDSEGLDLVIPTCEEVFYLADLHPAVFCPPLETLEHLHSKWRFLELAEGLGVEVPSSRLLVDAEELPADPRGWVFKLEFSRFGEGTWSESTEGLKPTPARRVVMQERLVGEELSGYGVAVRGELKAWVVYRPVYRLAGASSVFFRPVEDRRAREFARGLVERLEYHGQIAFDFMRTDDGLFVLECNPRATSGVHLFEQNIASVLRGDEISAGVVDKMLSPALGLVRPWPPLKTFIKDLWGARDAVFCWRDPLPLLGMAAHVVETSFLSLIRGVSLKAAMTRDLEWDGESFD